MKPLTQSIELAGIRHNNLKNLSVRFPLGQWTVITGLSGSGKSSLAFDTLYAEGQRRYIESLSTYTRQFLEKMPKPEVDSVANLPPAIALQQRNSVFNSRSTVASQTEVVDALRIIYARIGEQFCAVCGGKVKKIDVAWLLEEAVGWFPGRRGAVLAPLAPQPGSTPKTPKKSAKKKKAETAPRPRGVDAIFAALRARGLRRALWKKSKSEAIALDLEAMGTPDFPEVPEKALELGQLFAVVDRLKIAEGKEAGTEDRARLLDSLEQAIDLGRGEVAFLDLDSAESRAFEAKNACVKCGTEAPVPEPNLFSFNSPMGACRSCSGFGFTLDLDESLVVPDPGKTLKDGAIDPLAKPSFEGWKKLFFRFCASEEIPLGSRYSELGPRDKAKIWEGVGEAHEFPGIRKIFEDLAKKKYKLHVRVFIRRYQSQNRCVTCGGGRLKPAALAVKLGGLSIAEAQDLPITGAIAWIDGLTLTKNALQIAKEPLSQLARRLHYLEAVGVGYLSLSRLTKTLSGGEFQRIHLATQLGTGLCGTLYVLDEPSIGLHPADTERMIHVLRELRDQGNTVVVVEHDLEVMRAADWLVELGPGAGRRGGELVAMGDSASLQKVPGSLTAKYLSGAFRIERTRAPRAAATRKIKITGCREHNLKNLTIEFPLDRLITVTGVSGSGKSTLIHHTLFAALSKYFARKKGEPFNEPVGRFDKLYGAEQLRGVVLLDQGAIGKNSRSNPVTYMKAWDEVRKLYAAQPSAIRRGFTPQHFSFNVDGGRCPVCSGEGEITVDLHFMAEVKLPCEECEGKRFKRAVLEIKVRGKSVFELLETTIDEAYELFRDHPVLSRKLGILREVGLGYLQLGQSGAVLSGGESQRLKIAAALDERRGEHLLYVFDEPTTGLHPEDVKKLMEVIQDLVDARHSVILIEHNLDVIAQSDWVIDLGPGGGEEGGEVVGEGPPSALGSFPRSKTWEALEKQGYVRAERGLA